MENLKKMLEKEKERLEKERETRKRIQLQEEQIERENEKRYEEKQNIHFQYFVCIVIAICCLFLSCFFFSSGCHPQLTCSSYNIISNAIYQLDIILPSNNGHFESCHQFLLPNNDTCLMYPSTSSSYDLHKPNQILQNAYYKNTCYSLSYGYNLWIAGLVTLLITLLCIFRIVWLYSGIKCSISFQKNTDTFPLQVAHNNEECELQNIRINYDSLK